MRLTVQALDPPEQKCSQNAPDGPSFGPSGALFAQVLLSLQKMEWKVQKWAETRLLLHKLEWKAHRRGKV